MHRKGFPSRYKDAPPCVGDHWWQHYNAALDRVNKGGIVLLYGGPGTGKTRMAYELVPNIEPPKSTCVIRGVTKHFPAIYSTAVNLFMDIRETYQPKSERTEKQVVTELTDAALLVIDEIQERGETAFEDRKLTQIIDARYMHNKPTILISNHTREGFAKTLSPQVIDRIRENGCGLHFDWDSYRKPTP